MTAKDLELMLGLEKPWHVTSLEIDHATRKARLHVECEATTWADPTTGEALHIHGWQQRTWRHLDFWQYETELIARVPRVRHPGTGETMTVAVPWATPHSRRTLAFERLALEVLLAARSKTSRAWEIKELFGGFWEQGDALQEGDYFAKWHRRTQRCRLEPMKQLGRSFKASLPRLLNWFAHPISNALAEGFNSVIQVIKSAARGFRNFAHYRLRILFLLGKLDLSLP